MDIKVKKNIAGSTLEIDIQDRNDKEALAKAFVFTQPDICGICHGNQVVWESNKAKTDDGEFTYIKRKCIKPGCFASSTLGEYKTGGYFWKKWEVYVPKNGNTETPTVNYED